LWNRRQEMPVLGRDLHHVVDAGIVTNLHLRQTKVGALARVARTMSSMMVPPCAAATSHIDRNSTSVPNASSIRC
jgi:hypothetical protein